MESGPSLEDYDYLPILSMGLNGDGRKQHTVKLLEATAPFLREYSQSLTIWDDFDTTCLWVMTGGWWKHIDFMALSDLFRSCEAGQHLEKHRSQSWGQT